MSPELAKRIGVALVAIPVLIGATYLGGWWFTGAIAIIAFSASRELIRMLFVNGEAPRAYVITIRVLTTLVPIAAHLYGVAGVFVLLLGSMIVAGGGSLSADPVQGVRRMTTAYFTLIYLGASLATFVLIRDDARFSDPLHGLLVILYIWGGVWIADTAAYAVGRRAGRRPLAPSLSPKKTIEGSIGGVVAAVLWGWLASLALEGMLLVWQAVGVGLIIGVLAIVGDLVESVLKRSVGVKDSGSILPGHGGALDRIDSQLFVVPAIYLYFITLGVLEIV